MRNTYKNLRQMSAPLTYLKHPNPQEGDPIFISAKMQMDKLIIDSFAPIYAGNTTDQQGLTDRFFTKYHAHISKATEFNIGDLTTEAFATHCRAAEHSAASLDGWTTSEFGLFSDSIFHLLVVFLNRIELAGTWPSNRGP